MRSNQRPFARHNCRPRLLCPIVRRLRPTENLQNAFLNECEIVRAVRPSTSAGNFADPDICRRRINSRRTQRREKCAKGTRAPSLIFISTGKEDHLPDLGKNSEETVRAGLRLLAGGNIVWQVTLWSKAVYGPVFVSEGASKCKIKVNSLLSSLAWNKETIFAPSLRLSFTTLKRLPYESPVCRQTSYWNITTQYRSRTPYATIKAKYFSRISYKLRYIGLNNLILPNFFPNSLYSVIFIK